MDGHTRKGGNPSRGQGGAVPPEGVGRDGGRARLRKDASVPNAAADEGGEAREPTPTTAAHCAEAEAAQRQRACRARRVQVDAQTGRRVEGHRQGPAETGDQQVQDGAACFAR